MIKQKTKKTIYWFIVIFQGVSIIVTIINLIYCFITKNTYLFFCSNVALFIPQYYISYGGGIWNTIPLILFIANTAVLYYKSSVIILGVKKTRGFYVALNGFWLILCNMSYLMFFTFNTATGMSIPPYFSFANIYIWIVFIFIYVFVIYSKNNIFTNMGLNMLVNTYKDVRKYTYANSLISFFTIILAFWMHYFSDMPLSNPMGTNMIFLDYILYPIFWVINISLFIVNIIFYYNVKKKSDELLPYKHFFLRINLNQILSFMLSVISFHLTAFVLF